MKIAGRRAVTFTLLMAASAGGCGTSDGAGLSLVISARSALLTGTDSVIVMVMGSGANCGQLEQGIRNNDSMNLISGGVCGAGQVESGTCAIERTTLVISGGVQGTLFVSPGVRSVLGVGMEWVVEKAVDCVGPVSITAGEPTPVTLDLQPL